MPNSTPKTSYLRANLTQKVGDCHVYTHRTHRPLLPNSSFVCTKTTAGSPAKIESCSKFTGSQWAGDRGPGSTTKLNGLPRIFVLQHVPTPSGAPPQSIVGVVCVPVVGFMTEQVLPPVPLLNVTCKAKAPDWVTLYMTLYEPSP